MANEIFHNYPTGSNLYAISFALSGQVYLTGGTGPEDWGNGGNDADEYDVAMAETGASGHYVGSFNVAAAGVYRVAVYLRAGASPADSDTAIAQGVMYWDGSAEITPSQTNGDSVYMKRLKLTQEQATSLAWLVNHDGGHALSIEIKVKEA